MYQEEKQDSKPWENIITGLETDLNLHNKHHPCLP